MFFGFVFIAFLPGFLFLRFLLSIKMGIIEMLAFSYFMSMALISLFIMPISMVLTDVHVTVILFINSVVAISAIAKLKQKRGLESNDTETRSNDSKMLVIFSLIFFLNLVYNVASKIGIDGSLLIDWDHGMYLSIITSMSKGLPAMNLLRSGLSVGPEMAFFPHFYFYGVILDFTKIPVFYLVMFINALTHGLFTVAVYSVSYRLFRDNRAAIVSSFLLSLGSELYWIMQYVGLSFPATQQVPFNLYLGTAVPFDLTNGSVNVPSLGMDSIAKGFHHLPSLALCLLFIYFLSHFWERRRIALFGSALICLLPILPSQPLVFLFFVLSFLLVLPIALLYQKNNLRRVLPLVALGVLFVIIWFIALGVIGSEQFMIYTRYYPIWKTIACLFLYLGAPSIPFFLGLRYADIKNKATSVLLLSWISVCLFFILFTDLYHDILEGSWHGYFVYFSLQVPFMMFAGLGLSKLSQGLFHKINPRKDFLGKIIKSAGYSLMASVLVMGLIPHVQYYNSWVARSGSFWRTHSFQISTNELRAYEWINLNTAENSVFLANPDNWALSFFTGRSVVTTDRGISKNDERIVDVKTIFASASLRGTLLLLSKYGVNYVIISSIEKEAFGSHLGKFYSFPEHFSLKFSNEEINIIKVISLELPPTIATSLTITVDNMSKAKSQPIRVAGLLSRNDTGKGIENMIVTAEQYPQYQLAKGLSFSFDEGSSSICYDRSNNGNNGIIHGASWVSGKSNAALSFDGVDDYVEVPHSMSLSPAHEIRIDLWLSIAQYGDFKRILAKSPCPTSDYGLLLYSKSIYFFVTIGGIEYKSPLSKLLNLNTWYHVVCTYENGDKVRLYIDEEEQGNGTDATGTLDNHSGSLLLGTDCGSFFSGTMDELRIFNEATYSLNNRTDDNGYYEFQVVSEIAGSAKYRVRFDGYCLENQEFLACTSSEIALSWSEVAGE